jgi:flagellar biosynthesis protein FlhG
MIEGNRPASEQAQGLARWVSEARGAAPLPQPGTAMPASASAPVAARSGAEWGPRGALPAAVRTASGDAPARRPRPAGPRVMAVTGGKGGVGKSNLSLNFSLALRNLGRSVLLVDCDSGLGNIDVLLGLCPQRHLGHVLSGECSVAEALVHGPLGIDILPAASGLDALGKATAAEAGRLLSALRSLEARHDMILLDTSAGLGPQVRALLRGAPEVLIVTTPEPTALSDAYATLKVLHGVNPSCRAGLVVNMAETVREAEEAAGSVAVVAERYLSWRPEYLGFVPRDSLVPQAVRHQKAFFAWAPEGPAARAVRQLAAAWLDEAPPAPPAAEEGARNPGLLSVLWSFWQGRRGEHAGGVAGNG